MVDFCMAAAVGGREALRHNWAMFSIRASEISWSGESEIKN